MPTYIHLSSYCVGLILGAFLYETASRPVHLRPLVNVALWILAIVTGLTVLLITTPWNRGLAWTPLSAGVYGGAHRVMWSIAVAWCTFSCISGNAGNLSTLLTDQNVANCRPPARVGAINDVLSWHPFCVLSKLSYSLYLVHFLVIWARCAFVRDTMPFSHVSQVRFEFLGRAFKNVVQVRTVVKRAKTW